MIANVPRPGVQSLVAGTMTHEAMQQRLMQNQVAAERSGHIQSIPMTSAGIAQLRLLKDTLNRMMGEEGVTLGARSEILAASPEIALQGQMTRLEIAVARPRIQQLIAERQLQEQDKDEMPPNVDKND